MCSPIEYSGCGGNANNFKTLFDCENYCYPALNLIKEEVDVSNPMAQDLTIPEKKRICMSPKEAGQCSDQIERFYFDVQMVKCLPFMYSGCEGNLNNFETIKECEMTCDVLIDMARQNEELEEEENELLRNKEICMQPKEIGPCTDYKLKYYFDTTQGKCTRFYYGGCGSNENNFDTLNECESTCISLLLNDTRYESQEATIRERQESQERHRICSLIRKEGTCTKSLLRYAFDVAIKDCKPFYFSGCNGNENNFLTYEGCTSTCYDLMESNLFKPINCEVSKFSDWSPCSETDCTKNGKSYRTREILVEPKYGGSECPKVLRQVRKCTPKCKPKDAVDCVVSRWSNWSECKKHANKGVCSGYQERTRSIVQEAINGGKECPSLNEKRMCYIKCSL